MINPITTEFFIAVHRTGGSLCRAIIVGCGEIPITGRVRKDVVTNGRHFVLSRVLSQPPQHYRSTAIGPLLTLHMWTAAVLQNNQCFK